MSSYARFEGLWQLCGDCRPFKYPLCWDCFMLPEGSPAPREIERSAVLLDVLDRLRADTITFMGKLDSFLKNKRGILDVYVSAVGPLGVDLEALIIPTVDDFKVSTSTADDAFNASYLQPRVAATHGVGSVTTMDELYESANAALSTFTVMVNEIGAAVGGSVVVEIAPLKGRNRAQKKADDDYIDRISVDGQGGQVHAPAIGWLYDIVRMRFVCNTAGEIQQVLAKVLAHSFVKAVLKGKNRFAVKTANGFCDLLLHVLISVDMEVGGSRVLVEHVCEIQMHLRAVTEYANIHGSHESYDYFRTYFDGSMDTVTTKLQHMEHLIGQDYERVAEEEYADTIVIEQLILNIQASQDTTRLQVSQRFWEEIEEFELAVHIGRIELVIHEDGSAPDRKKSIAATYNRMARSLEKHGKSGEAFAMVTKALEMQLEELGPDDPTVARTYQVLAHNLKNQGKLEDAHANHEKSLAINLKRAAAEPDNHRVQLSLATNYNSIAVLHDMQGHKDVALELYKKVLKLREEHVPLVDRGQIRSHQLGLADIAMAHNNIAGVLATQGPTEQVEAMDMFKKALAIKLKAFGPNHTSVGNTYEGIGTLLFAQGKLGEAKIMYKKALVIALHAFDKNHPDVKELQVNMSKVNQALAQ